MLSTLEPAAPKPRRKRRAPFRWRPQERRTLVAFASALVEDGLPALTPSQHPALLAEAERTVNVLPRVARDGFHVFLSILEFVPLVLGHFRTFSRLSIRERVRLLRAWGNSSNNRLRMPFLGIKAMLGMAIASLPPVEESVGYRRECLTGNAHVRSQP